MEPNRSNPQTTAPDLYRALRAVERYLADSVDRRLLHLVKLRASMLNGCAFCVDLHAAEALADGEAVNRLFGLAAWREAPFYDDAERAALALTDAVTRLGDDGVPDGVWEGASMHFDDKELVDLVGAIAMINLWNRVAITLRTTPASARAAA